MNLSKFVIVATTFALLLFNCSVVAQADDLLPPVWRGGPLSVEAHWEFDYPQLPPDPMPADFFNSIGSTGGETLYRQQPPLAKIFNFNNMQYDPIVGGPLDGGWVAGPEDGFIDFSLPNWVDLEPEKRVYVQMSFINLGGNTPPSIELIEAFDALAFPGISYQGFAAGGGAIDDNHLFVNWLILPNPDWEIIKVRVPVDMALTEVVIDTISIPEPATTLLLLLGFTGILISNRSPI